MTSSPRNSTLVFTLHDRVFQTQHGRCEVERSRCIFLLSSNLKRGPRLGRPTSATPIWGFGMFHVIASEDFQDII